MYFKIKVELQFLYKLVSSDVSKYVNSFELYLLK